MNNENEIIMKSRRRRIERENKKKGKKKSLLNRIKPEKKKKNIDKIAQLEIELVKIKYANSPKTLQNKIKELNK